MIFQAGENPETLNSGQGSNADSLISLIITDATPEPSKHTVGRKRKLQTYVFQRLSGLLTWLIIAPDIFGYSSISSLFVTLLICYINI